MPPQPHEAFSDLVTYGAALGADSAGRMRMRVMSTALAARQAA
jgi:hypothetical protein